MAAQGYGFQSHVGLVRENSFGVLAGARTDFLKCKSEGLALTIERFEPVNVHGANYKPDDDTGSKGIEGEITIPAHPESVGLFLAACLGISSTAEVAGNLMKTTFTSRPDDLENERALDSYSIEVYRHDVTSAFIYRGMLLSKVSLSVQPNQELQVVGTWMGKAVDIGSASTPTFPGSPALPFTFKTCSISLGGAASNIFQNLTIDIDNGLDAENRVNASDEAFAIKRNAPKEIKVTATAGFDNLTEYQNFVDQTEQSLVLYFTKANSFSLKIDLPRVKWTSHQANASGRDRITAAIEGEAWYHTGSGQLVQMELVNMVTSGYPLAENGL